MASKKHRKGGLSRRDFIKTTTAATAVASVGIKPSIPPITDPEPLSPNSDHVRQPAWVITDKEIQILWTEIWPKIVALAWWSEEQRHNPSFRHVFARNAQFRKDEVRRIAQILNTAGITNVNYISEIPICVTEPRNLKIFVEDHIQLNLLVPLAEGAKIGDEYGFGGWSSLAKLYRDTFFTINAEGIVMPWPETPSIESIFTAYWGGGGIVPRENPTWPTSPSSPEYNLFQRLIDFSLPDTDTETACDPTGLTGVALLTLFEKWPKVVAQAWGIGPIMKDHIINNLQDYIMPEVWTQWPNFLTEGYDDESDDIKLAHEDNSDMLNLIVPLPDPPPDANHIFQELIVGYATNPMYSNCY